MSWVGNTVYGVGYVGEKVESFFLLIVRLYWGWLFCAAGLGKFTAMDGMIAFLSQAGVPAPAFTAYLVAIVELLGGVCLFFGIASRFAGLILMFVMFVAYAMAHHEGLVSFFSNPETFISQAPFSYLLASMVIFFCGPGYFSLDRLVFRRNGPI